MPIKDTPYKSVKFPQNEWSIEMLRGLAAMMVLYAHYWQIAGIDRNIFAFSYTGVNLFFVISGFVFAPYFFGKRILNLPFLIRRFFRIYPLYVAALCFYAGLRFANNQDVEHFLSHLFFLHTTQSKEIAFYYNPAFWSLPPEIEFYLALPLLCKAVQGSTKVWALIGLALFLHLLIALTDAKSTTEGHLLLVLSLHLPGLLIEFLLGIVAWLIVSQSPGHSIRILIMLCGISLWLILAIFFRDKGDEGIDALWWLKGNIGIIAAFSYALIVSAIVGWLAEPPILLRKIAESLGNISFGVYLFHNAMPIALKNLVPHSSGLGYTILCFGATVLLAYLAHYCYEKPLRLYGRALANRYSA
jgi:peptidoglycan/LPS O-acetylase OafA/YrhL